MQHFRIQGAIDMLLASEIVDRSPVDAETLGAFDEMWCANEQMPLLERYLRALVSRPDLLKTEYRLTGLYVLLTRLVCSPIRITPEWWTAYLGAYLAGDSDSMALFQVIAQAEVKRLVYPDYRLPDRFFDLITDQLPSLRNSMTVFLFVRAMNNLALCDEPMLQLCEQKFDQLLVENDALDEMHKAVQFMYMLLCMNVKPTCNWWPFIESWLSRLPKVCLAIISG
jgi:hypothetical protein